MNDRLRFASNHFENSLKSSRDFLNSSPVPSDVKKVNVRILLVIFYLMTLVACGRFWGNIEETPESTTPGADAGSGGGGSDGGSGGGGSGGSGSSEFCTGSALTNSPYAGGSGTSGDPYLICTATQWDNLGSRSQDWALYFKLKTNIDLSSLSGSYKFIGTSATPFTGSLDGSGYIIQNLTVSKCSI